MLEVSQNALWGTVPECITELTLEWLWLEENRIHGPISEYASLGQYLKNVDSLNLAQNRWAPLLRSEKAALEAAAEPLGITAGEQKWNEHLWDFSWGCEWNWVLDTDDLWLKAAREVSLRYWAAGAPMEGFAIALPFEFLWQETTPPFYSPNHETFQIQGFRALHTACYNVERGRKSTNPMEFHHLPQTHISFFVHQTS